MTDYILELDHVSLVLRGHRVLDDICLQIPAGEFLGLIGPNGAGKTLLLRVILGLLKPTQGNVRVLGAKPERARRFVGYVPQYARFDADFPISVIDAVLMGRLGLGGFSLCYSAEEKELADYWLERMGLSDKRNLPVGKLSGGQIQRVLIARALVREPKLLLLDEPTASVDAPVGAGVYEILHELSRTMTIVLVSHDLGVISSQVTSIACLKGKLHYHGSQAAVGEVLQEMYGCPIDLLAHGHAHRVLSCHEGDGHRHD